MRFMLFTLSLIFDTYFRRGQQNEKKREEKRREKEVK